jgi:hypothetical protein
VCRKNGSRPLDLGPITHQSSDQTGVRDPERVEMLAIKISEILRSRESGRYKSQTPRVHLDRPSIWTHVRNPQRLGIFSIEKSEFLRSKELGHHKSLKPDKIKAIRLRGHVAISRAHRHIGDLEGETSGSTRSRKSERLDQDRPFVGTRGRDLGHRGKSRRGGRHWSLVHRDIVDPGDKLSVHF